MKIITRAISLSLCFNCAHYAAQAEIYSYVDADGQTHFTDQPPMFQSRKLDKIPDEIKESQDSSKVTRIYRYEEIVDGQTIVHLADKPKNSGYVLIYEGIDDCNYTFGSSEMNPEMYITSAQVISGDSEQSPVKNKHKKASPRKSSVSRDSKQKIVAKSSRKKRNKYRISKKYAVYDDLIRQVAVSNNLEPALLHALIQTESAYNPNAVSPKGAVGLMQLMPATAKRYGVTDRTDIESSIKGGATYLRDLLKLFKNDKKLALAAYNAGEKAVKKYGNAIPPYRETKHYVKKVIGLYDQHLAQSK